MGKRNLRIVKSSPHAVGLCETCNAMFKSHLHQAAQAEWEIKVQYERHKCTPQDAKRNAARVVREGIQSKPASGNERKRLLELCSIAANERNHDRLMELVEEIVNIFEASKRRQQDEPRWTD